MKNTKHLILSAFILISLAAEAQQVYTLTDCIDYSLKNHASNEIYSNNIQVAEQQKKQLVSAYLPQANGSLTYFDNLKLPTTIIPAGITGPTEKEVQFGQKYNSNFSVDITQTIYDQSKIYGIKTGEAYTEVSKLQKTQNQESLIYNTSTAYLQVLVYDELASKLKNSIATYQQMLQITELQYTKGVALKTDVDRLKVTLNATQYQLDEAETQQKLALNLLKNAMGYPLGKDIVINYSVNYDDIVNLPYGNSFNPDSLSEYNIYSANIVLQKLNLQSKKAAYLPTLNSVARFGNQAYNSSFSQSFANWNSYSYIGLSLNVPIFSGLRRQSQVSESRLSYENAKINLQLTEQNMQMRYDNSSREMLSAHNNYFNSKANLELATSIFNKTSLSYQKGTATLTDFLSDDNANNNARVNYITSLYNYMSARLNYEKSKGTLFSFYNQLKNK